MELINTPAENMNRDGPAGHGHTLAGKHSLKVSEIKPGIPPLNFNEGSLCALNNFHSFPFVTETTLMKASFYTMHKTHRTIDMFKLAHLNLSYTSSRNMQF